MLKLESVEVKTEARFGLASPDYLHEPILEAVGVDLIFEVGRLKPR